MSPSLLGNSVALAAVTTVLAAVWGIPMALGMHLAPAPLRRWLVAAAVGVLALPGFFVAGMWMEWVGFAGAWRIGKGFIGDRWLTIGISSWVLSLSLWPVFALGLAGVWDRLDVRHLEAEPALRGWALFRWVLWPMARTAIVGPILVTAVLALGQFSVPALFQARVWPVEVWVSFATRFDVPEAVGLCWPLLAVPIGLAVLVRRAEVTWWRWGARAESSLVRARLGRGWTGAVLVAMVVVLGLSIVLPVGQALLQPRTWSELVPAFRAAAPAAGRSVAYAAGTATVVLLAGIVAAGWRPGAALVLFMAGPGIFIGVGLAEVTGWPGGSGLRNSPAIVLLGLCLRYAFVGWLAGSWARTAADPRLLDLIRLQSGSRMPAWRHAIGPASWRMLAGAWYVVYLLCLWEVETAILIVPPGGDTVSMMVFQLLHYGHNAQVTALCVLLGMLAFVPPMFGSTARTVRWAWQRLVALRSTAITGLAAIGGVMIAGVGCGSDHDSARGRALDSALFERVEVIGSRGTGPGSFVKPRSVAVDHEDLVFAVDMTGRVQKFTPEGRWLLSWQMEETDKGRPKGMESGPGEGVLVVEPHYHRVNHFASDGRLIARWGRTGTNAGELWFPRAVALGRDGDCYVTEYGRQERVQRFQVDGRPRPGGFGVEGTGPGQLNRAEGIGVDAAGNVYVADSCNHRIQVFASDGRFLRAHGSPGSGPGQFRYPYDIRVDGQGRQYVCEFGNSRVQILDADDRPLEILGGAGSGPDRMNNPWSLCLDSRGNLYVADALNHRLLRFVARHPTAAPDGA